MRRASWLPLGFDGNVLGMDGTEVCVLKEADEVDISGLLQRGDSRALDNAVSCIKVVYLNYCQ